MVDKQLPIPNELMDIIATEMEGMGIDYFIVGAMARDINLSFNPQFFSSRLTEDVDIAIQVSNIEEFHTFIQRILNTGLFKVIDKEPIKLLFNNAIELDLLPFGEIETIQREVRIPMAGGPFVLSVPGLEEVKQYSKELQLPNGRIIYYCPLEGIVLLKLISWYEQPGRTKDGDDISHICNIYFDYAGDEIFNDAHDLLEAYDTSDYFYQKLVASHYLGRKVRKMSNENLMILDIINKQLEKRDGVFRALLEGINDNL